MSTNAGKTYEQRMDADREELAGLIAGILAHDGQVQPKPGLIFNRLSSPSEPLHGAMEPAFCVIAQGAKEITFGADRFRYDPAHYLIATVGMPGVGRIVEASSARPYLAVRVVLEPAIVTAAMVESGVVETRGGDSMKAAGTSPLDASLLDAMLRLVRLLDSPDQYRTIGPLVIREIVYRLLGGTQAGRLRHLAAFGGHANRMARAVGRLSGSFDKPVRVEELAGELGMSASGFHVHFKAVTGMSPLQFHKQLRLQEARRLMLDANLDAGEAGYRVGYEDRAHFSREYKRHFGEPPIRDVERLRDLVAA
jgi:AraC-like DNA-binding protein